MSKPAILIAGGGTGGHVFPAVAVAEAIHALADAEVVFFGTARGVEARVVPARGWRLERLDVLPMKGGGPVRAVRGAAVAARATVQSLRLVRALRPRVVLSVGGYAAGPGTLAAALLGGPVAVGLANRILAPFAKRAYLAWPEAAGRFRTDALRWYGVPLRQGFSPRPYAARAAAARVLVMGGSQGAAALNERVPDAISRLSSARGVEVLHQAGRGRDDVVRAAYARGGVKEATVVAFIDDVAQAIEEADVVVARAGAATIAEISAIGRASVLVPFAHASDEHQARNAEALERAGAALCLRQDAADPARLATEIGTLLEDDARRVAMADASRARGRPNAAHDVASDLLTLASIPRRAPDRTRRDGGAVPGVPGEVERSA